MTNKKLKLAAMSVALTACVAAQPMAAHAVEGPDSVEDNAAPQAEPAPVEGKTAEGEVEGEEEKCGSAAGQEGHNGGNHEPLADVRQQVELFRSSKSAHAGQGNESIGLTKQRI